MEISSYGYHSNNGAFYHGAKELPTAGPPFGESDVIGCGVNFVTNSVFFTKNGVFMGPISTGKKLPHPVYPCIALACPNCHVSANFGQHKFTFDIGQYIARERAVVISMAVDRKCNEQLAHVTMRNLVAAYMLHNGYLESARALGGWISKASTKGTTSQSVNGSTDADPLLHGSAVKEPPDPGDARTPGSDVGNLSSPESLGAPKPVTNGESAASRRAELSSGLKELFQWPEATELLLKRRHLRDTIRSGDYLSALEQLETHFRSLSEQDPSISFVLRCHHFIDLICNQQKRAVTAAPVISSATSSPIQRNAAQSLYHTEPPRMAQKRPNPSSSAESSPDATLNGSCVPHITTGYPAPEPSPATRPVRPSSVVTGFQQSSRTHEHSPSSCQAPIRLRLDPAEVAANKTQNNNSNNNTINIYSSGENNNGNGNGSKSSPPPTSPLSTPVPIYPPNHMCYRETPSCCPVNTLSLTPGESELDIGQPDNHVHTVTDEPAKKEHRLVNSLRLGGAVEFSHFGSSVGLLESLPEQRTSLGNGVTRSKCVNIIRRGKMTSPTPDKSSPPLSTVTVTACAEIPVDRCSTGLISPAPLSTVDFPPDSKSGHAVNRNTTARDSPVLNGCRSNGSALSSVRDGDPVCSHSNTQPVRPCSLNRAQKQPSANHPACLTGSLSNNNWSTDDVLNLVEYGRMLRTAAMELKQKNAISPSQIQLLSGAFGLIAYQDPYTSPFRRFLDPSHRDCLADAVNSAIMVHLNQPATPVLDSALTLLERSLTEDDSTLTGVRGVHFGGASGAGSLSDRLRSGSDRAIYSAAARSDVTPGPSEASHSATGPLDFTNPHRLVSHFDRLISPESPVSVGPISSRHSRPYSTPADSTHHSFFGTHSPLAEIDANQDNSLRPNDNNNSNNNNNNSSSASIVASSIYIPPSALVSFSSRPRQSDSSAGSTRASLSTTAASAAAQTASRILSTGLRHAFDSSRQNQPRSRHSASSTPPLAHTGSIVTSNVAGWSGTQGGNQTTRELSQSPQQRQSSVPSAAARLAVTSYLTDTHAPTGPELAGFFHPLLFID
ncbi:hypothetical protein D915_007666 [Fasciola hepatica]|uniref:Ran-binding protein 9 n=1 Tax=Fasciola hepatica TaxID=6192 RepID=A0A4E0R6A6_FASHE|nr:hypothetical protein D915_007666 [Fasciola hepatica]